MQIKKENIGASSARRLIICSETLGRLFLESTMNTYETICKIQEAQIASACSVNALVKLVMRLIFSYLSGFLNFYNLNSQWFYRKVPSRCSKLCQTLKSFREGRAVLSHLRFGEIDANLFTFVKSSSLNMINSPDQLSLPNCLLVSHSRFQILVNSAWEWIRLRFQVEILSILSI